MRRKSLKGQLAPSQLWNRVKAFVEQTIPDAGRSVKDEVAAKVYQEMKFLIDDRSQSSENRGVAK